MLDGLTLLASVFAATAATRLPPGPANLAAFHLTLVRRRRQALALLAGLTLVDAAVFLVATRVTLSWSSLLGSDLVRFAGVAVLGVMAVVLALTPDRDAVPPPAAATHGPFWLGVVIGISQPGRWAWWATVGLMITSASRAAGEVGIALGLCGFLGGLAALYTGLLVVAGRALAPPGRRTRRWLRWISAAVLAAWAVGLALWSVG